MRSLATAANGDVYVGGSFTAVGGVPANYIARWDGTAWNGLGNGAAATPTPANNGVNAIVYALAWLGSDLYVAGRFTTAYTTAGSQALNNLARWAGGAWQGLGNGTATATTTNNGAGGTVYALVGLGADLYVGGSYTSVYSVVSGTLSLANIARWDGTAWNPLGTGLNGSVRALAAAGWRWAGSSRPWATAASPPPASASTPRPRLPSAA